MGTAGAIADLYAQLMKYRGNWACIDWNEVALAGAAGLALGLALGFLGPESVINLAFLGYDIYEGNSTGIALDLLGLALPMIPAVLKGEAAIDAVRAGGGMGSMADDLGRYADDFAGYRGGTAYSELTGAERQIVDNFSGFHKEGGRIMADAFGPNYTYLGPRDITNDSAMLKGIPTVTQNADPDIHYVFGHGLGDGFYKGVNGWTNDIGAAADMVLSNPNYAGQVCHLMMCWAGFGDNPIAQNFANELGQGVIGSNTRIHYTGIPNAVDYYSISASGKFMASDKLLYEWWLENPDTEVVNMIFGTWKGFMPK